MIQLGDVVVDVISGFEGTVTGEARYLTGCRQLCVQPHVRDTKGGKPSAEWFDEARLERTGSTGLLEGRFAPTALGGPQHDAPPGR